MSGCRLDASGSELGPVAFCCEHGNEPSGTIKSEEFPTFQDTKLKITFHIAVENTYISSSRECNLFLECEILLSAAEYVSVRCSELVLQPTKQKCRVMAPLDVIAGRSACKVSALASSGSACYLKWLLNKGLRGEGGGGERERERDQSTVNYCGLRGEGS